MDVIMDSVVVAINKLQTISIQKWQSTVKEND